MPQHDDLTHLVEEGIIDAVHVRLMSGKEATVYIVEREGHLGAAKVYKARDERTFKKTASYVEGRNQTRNSRDRRAMQNKSSYGRGLIEEGWQEMEFRALRDAFDAGVRVPEPYFLYENVLFMELVVDDNGAPASRLADFPFTPEEATRLHLEVFMQVKKLLETGRVHGDLSAYNVLMAAKGPTIIDLPQVVEVSGNNNARQILRRDLRNVTEHLARFDARLLRFVDCGDMLFAHLVRGTLDAVAGPEEGAHWAQGAGRRGRDAERGRAGRDKNQRPPPPAVKSAGFGPPRNGARAAGPQDGGRPAGAGFGPPRMGARAAGPQDGGRPAGVSASASSAGGPAGTAAPGSSAGHRRRRRHRH
jgi:RIO kinase 1